jgi:integrase/recombinase XerC/integrase/recombinase XerD
MNHLDSLEGQLKVFLLSCRVDELSPNTLYDYNQKIGAFARYCNTVKPRDITANHVRLFLVSLQARCTPHSVKDYYGCVNRFFNWMVDEGTLERNPMASMHPPRVPKKIIQPFKMEQIRDLLLLCDENRFLGARNKAIVLTLLDTGLRLTELANIQLADVDFDRETIKVMGKGAKERVVRIGKRTQKAILRYLLMRKDNQPCLWVTEERRPLRAMGIQIMIKRLGKRIGIKGVRCSAHTFRHTFATRALLNGAGEFEVQSLLGHEGLSMTRRYTASLKSEAAVEGHRRFSPVDNMKL